MPRGLVVLIILFMLFLSSGAVARFYTDWLWFQEVGYSSVFAAMWRARLLIGLLIGLFFFAALYANGVYARKAAFSLPVPIGPRWIPVDDKLMLDRYAGRILFLLCAVAAGIAGLIAASRWSQFLKFFNAQPFGLNDPMFGKDISFFVLRMPAIEFAWSLLMAALLLSILIALGAYLYDEAIQMAGEKLIIAPQVKTHLSVLAGLLFIAKSLDYLLQAWRLVVTRTETVSGAGFTASKIILPVSYFLAAFCLIAGVIVLAIPAGRKMHALAIAAGVLLIASLVLKSALPAVVQGVIVKPNELVREFPYLRRNIQFTRHAYAIGRDNIVRQAHPGKAPTSAETLRRNRMTFNNIRLWDIEPLRLAYRQLQEIRPYFVIRDIDVDRYRIGGDLRQVMLAAREVRVPARSRTWINERLVYTHGFGVVVSPVNEASANGNPAFFVDNIPPHVRVPELQINQPRIYFGDWREQLPVGAPGFAPVRSLSRGQRAEEEEPDRAQAEERDPSADYVIVKTSVEELDHGSERSRYAGEAGVPLSNVLRRWAFSLRFFDPQLALSRQITSQSRVIFNRAVRERAEAIAPFLRFDADPYCVIANGRILWVLDAYTIGENFPYSERMVRTEWNYIRNSVKVIIDAYHGTTRFYLADEADPIVRTYRRIFPRLFRDIRELDRDFPGVRAHLRYPEALFTIQARMLTRYHMDSPQDFYNNEDLWQIPLSSTLGGEASGWMQPYYVVIRPPGAERETFMLIIPFDRYRDEAESGSLMAAWLAAPCDPPDYGPPVQPKLRLYTFPKGKQVNGPEQIISMIKSQRQISEQLTLWGQRGSRVLSGNLQVVPVEETLLYAVPIYLAAEREEQAQIPRLQKVIVVRPDAEPVMADSLEEALASAFASLPGIETLLSERDRAPQVTKPAPGPRVGAPPRIAATQPALTRLANEALEHYRAAVRHRQSGNWEGFGRSLDQLGEALENMREGK